MSKSFEVLRAKMTPEQRKRSKARAKEIMAELALRGLRKSLNITQEQLAKILRMKQSAVSRFEGQGDMYISTLSRVIIALGGRLKLIAAFPDKEVEIRRFTREK